MMTRTEDEIKRLTERFFFFFSTLDEEEVLYAYYSQTNIAARLEEYAEVMRGFGSLPIQEEKRQRPGIIKNIYRRIAIAASITILIGIGTFILQKVSTPDEECVAYIYGKKSTDRDMISQELRRSMNEICEMTAEDDIKSQLQDLFIQE